LNDVGDTGDTVSPRFIDLGDTLCIFSCKTFIVDDTFSISGDTFPFLYLFTVISLKPDISLEH